MPLKENIKLWSESVTFYENGDFSLCLNRLSQVDESAKIRYNHGMVNLRMNRTEDALKNLSKAIELDSFMALAYFQRALLFFASNRYEECNRDLELAWKNLRGSVLIDYRQLGLQTKLHSAQILYNTAVVKKSVGDNKGVQTFMSQFEKCEKDEELFSRFDHFKLNEMVQLNPPYGIFCPPRGFVSNLKKKDFLGKSEVVSSVEDHDFVNRITQKSNSNPSTPSSARKNNLATHHDTRMAVTPPPTRPPPRPKGSDFSKHATGNPNRNTQSGVSFKPIPQRPIPVLPVEQVPQRPVPSVLSTLPRAPPGRPPPISNSCDINQSLANDKKVKPGRPPPPNIQFLKD